MRSMRKFFLGLAAPLAMTAGFGGVVGANAPTSVDQGGLVNLNLTGVTVQLPIGLAANALINADCSFNWRDQDGGLRLAL